jgi:hypothetical protein
LHTQLNLVIFIHTLSLIELLENEIENARHNSHEFRREADRATSAHRECLATSGLAIGQNRRIIASEAAQNQVMSANVEQIFLVAFAIEHPVKGVVFV